MADVSYSYDEILDRMKNKFYELSGYTAGKISDAEIRMKVLAGEIFSLTSQAEYIKKQMFVTTASGEALDQYAAQTGITRKKGDKAKGRIMFKLDVPLEYDLTLPKGILCTTSDGTLNYITTESAEIERGSSYALVACEAENSGRQYNVSSESVKTIVTYFSVGIAISNSVKFTGGTNDESDEELRKRIMEYMSNKPNGVNKAYYIALAESVEGVHSASLAATDIGMIYMNIAGKGKNVSDEVLAQTKAYVNENKTLGVSVSIHHAELVEVSLNVKISVKNGFDAEQVINHVQEAIESYFENISVGTSITGAKIGNVIFSVEGVENYSLTDFVDITMNYDRLPVLKTLSVVKV